MTFFKIGKKRKDESLDMPIPSLDSQVPSQPSLLEQVLIMKQQGYQSNQITQILQSQGYETPQIHEAMNQAGLGANSQDIASQPNIGFQDYGQQQGYEQNYNQQQFENFQPKEPQSSLDEERIQEIAEAIIEEKWQDIIKDIRVVVEWKERTEDRIAKLEQQIVDLRIGMDSLTKSIMSKISSYDQNIVDVGTEMKAMEKVFQKVLPTLTESVNKLDRMTKVVKEPQRSEKINLQKN